MSLKRKQTDKTNCSTNRTVQARPMSKTEWEEWKKDFKQPIKCTKKQIDKYVLKTKNNITPLSMTDTEWKDWKDHVAKQQWKRYFLNLLRNDQPSEENSKTDKPDTSNNSDNEVNISPIPVNSMMYFLQLVQNCQDNKQNTT